IHRRGLHHLRSEYCGKHLQGPLWSGVRRTPVSGHLPGAAWRQADRDRRSATHRQNQKELRRKILHLSPQLRIAALSAAVIAFTTSSVFAQKKYDTGASDTQIKIGNIIPYSGPASAYGVIGKTEEAYFNKINAEGGINGRKISFVTYDDAYSPPKAVEQVR